MLNKIIHFVLIVLDEFLKRIRQAYILKAYANIVINNHEVVKYVTCYLPDIFARLNAQLNNNREVLNAFHARVNPLVSKIIILYIMMHLLLRSR